MACAINSTLAGTKISIGTSVVVADCDTQAVKADYEAVADFTAIGVAETFAFDGQDWNIQTFKPLAGGEGKAKGSRQHGSATIDIVTASGDAGQAMLETAEASMSNYALKFVYPDGTIMYTQGLVVSLPPASGGQEDLIKQTAKVELTQAIIKG